MSAIKLEPWERWALGAVLVVAAALRLYKLDAPLWFDEIATITEFVRAPVSQLIADYSSFNNHLFFSLQAKLSTSLFGETAWAARLPAMLFGLGSIWLTWRLARRMLGPAEALLVAALLATSYHHIWFSQNARGYTELMFWSLASLVVFVEGIGEKSIGRWALFSACLAAAMYTHLTAAFFIAALGLVYAGMLLARWFAPARAPSLLTAPQDRAAQWAPMFGFIGGGVLTLILCAPALPQMTSLVAGVKEVSEVEVMREYHNPLWTILEGLRTLGGGGFIALAAPFAFFFAALGAAGLWRRDPVTVLVGVLAIPVTIAALDIMSMRIWPRFFFTEIAFAFLFMTHGVFMTAGFFSKLAAQWTPRLPATQTNLFALAALVMLAASMVLAVRNYAAPKQNFPAAISLIEREGAPASSVGVVGWGYYPLSAYYGMSWKDVRKLSDLDALAPQGEERWIVAAFPERTSRENADIWAVLEKSYERIAYIPGTLGDGGIVVFRSKPSEEATAG